MPRIASGKLMRLARSALAMLLVAMVWCLTSTACSTTTIGENNPEKPVGQIVPARLAIVHTGGIQGAFARSDSSLGIAAVAQLAAELEEEGYDVLVLDSGNSLGGSPAIDLTDGEEAVAFMNAAHYDAIALGADELSLGSTRLRKRMAQSDFAYLSASVHDAQGDPLADPCKTFALSDGRLVGVFGLSAPKAAKGLGPLASADIVAQATTSIEQAQEQVADLRSQGCRLIVCLANLGFDDQGTPLAERVSEGVSGIDVLLDASTGNATHLTSEDASGEEMLVVETPNALKGASVVRWEQGSLSIDVHDPSTDKVLDEQVDALVTQSSVAYEDRMQKVVSTSAGALTAEAATKETGGLGSLAAAALLWSGERKASDKPDAAIVTADLLQASLAKGDVTYGDALAVLPHADSRLCTIEVTGAQLQQALEPLLAQKVAQSDTLPATAGITISRGSTTTKTGDKKATTQKQKAPAIERVGGAAFKASATYTIVTCEAALSRTGSLSALASKDATPQDLDVSGGQALADYLSHECKKGIPKSFLDQ